MNVMMLVLSAQRGGGDVEAVECGRFDFERPRGLMREGPSWLPYAGATVKIVGPARWQVRKPGPRLFFCGERAAIAARRCRSTRLAARRARRLVISAIVPPSVALYERSAGRRAGRT